MRRFLTLCTAILLACLAAAAEAQDRPRVVAANYPLQVFAERLLQDDAEVVFPVPAGVDPSFWRPSIADISMIQSADLILLNGAGFATWVDRVSLPRSKVVNTSAAFEDRFIVTKSITHSHGDGGEHSHEGLATYTWLDPTLAIGQAEAIAAAINRRGLAPAGEVAERLAALRADLEAIDEDAAKALGEAAGIPIYATHPRYQYFARRYGLSMTFLEWEAGAMPDGQALDDLRDRVADKGAGILIWEAEPPPAGFEATTALGLENVVFQPLAHEVDGLSFAEAFTNAVASLSQALEKAPGK